VDSESIELTVDNNTLTVKAERQAPALAVLTTNVVDKNSLRE